MAERIKIGVKRLQAFIDRPWYFPAIGLLAGLDLFILMVPTDALLISSVMLRPRKWVQAFVYVGLGASVGAAVLAGVIQWDSALVMERWFPSAFESSAWATMDAFFDRHGTTALFLIALSPLVQFPAVILAALAGMSVQKIFLVCLVGRMAKAAAFSWAASHAPKLLLKLPFMKQELSMIDAPTPKET